MNSKVKIFHIIFYVIAMCLVYVGFVFIIGGFSYWTLDVSAWDFGFRGVASFIFVFVILVSAVAAVEKFT